MDSVTELYRNKLRAKMESDHMTIYDLAKDMGIGWYTLNNFMKSNVESYGVTYRKIKNYINRIDSQL